MLSGHTAYTRYTRYTTDAWPDAEYFQTRQTRTPKSVRRRDYSAYARRVSHMTLAQFEHVRTLCSSNIVLLEPCAATRLPHSPYSALFFFLELFYCSIDTLLPRWLTVTLGPYHCTQCYSNGTSSAARSRSSKNFGKRRGSPRTFFAKFEQFFEQTKFELLQTAAQFAILIEREHDRWSVVVCGEDWWRLVKNLGEEGPRRSSSWRRADQFEHPKCIVYSSPPKLKCSVIPCKFKSLSGLVTKCVWNVAGLSIRLRFDCSGASKN